MKYVPRQADASVNVPKEHPLVDLAWLLGGIGAILVVGWLLLGLAVDYAVDHLPAGLEQSLAENIVAPDDADDDGGDGRLVRAVLDRLNRQRPPGLEGYDVRLSVTGAPDVNAFAMPGGRVVVLKGLLDTVESENELAMVLGHELGHLAHRDPLRGMGRAIVIMVAATLVLGTDNPLNDYFSGAFTLGHARFARGQEAAADAYGLDLLAQAYGHVGGATAFFRRMQAQDVRWAAWLASHPLAEDRIAALEMRAAEKGYRMGDTVPLRRAEASSADLQ